MSRGVHVLALRAAAETWIARSSRAMTNSFAVSVSQLYSCPSSVSPPETSTLPGAGSRLSFLTTPSSTSIE